MASYSVSTCRVLHGIECLVAVNWVLAVALRYAHNCTGNRNNNIESVIIHLVGVWSALRFSPSTQ